jgi:hypothetical protein
MPYLEGYTGEPPNEFAQRVFDTLESNGFKIATTTQGPVEGSSRTLRVTYRGIYIGQMRDTMWMAQPPFALLYRFPAPAPRLSVAHAHVGLDIDEFAREHGIDPLALSLRFESSENKSYLRVRDIGAALKLMQDWQRSLDPEMFPISDSLSGNAEEDVRVIQNDPTKSLVQKRIEIDARRGQGKYRADLLEEFENACAVTELTLTPALRASHIVPWSRSDDDAKINPKNGLLLSANVDALFDRYLITFQPDGSLRKSCLLSPRDVDLIGPLSGLKKLPCSARAVFLRDHNARFDALEIQRGEHVKKSAK